MNPQKESRPLGKREVYFALALVVSTLAIAIAVVNLHAYRPPSTFFIPAGILIFIIIFLLIFVFIDENREKWIGR